MIPSVVHCVREAEETRKHEEEEKQASEEKERIAKESTEQAMW